MRAALALACGLAIACDGDRRGRGERRAQLATCADAIERAGAAAPGEQVELVARGCTPACPGLVEWLAARSAARVRPGVERVVEVPPGAALAPCAADGDSEEASALAAVARWVDATAEDVDDGDLARRLEHVTSAATFTLPLPPAAAPPAARFRTPSRARQFVAIGPELRTGVVPHARLRGGRVERGTVAGAHPGQRVALDQLGAVFARHRSMLDGDPSPVLVIAAPDAALATVLEVITRLGVEHAELATDAGAHPVLVARRGSAFAVPEVELTPTGAVIRGFGDDRVAVWDHLDAELDHFAAVNAPVRAVELRAHDRATVADLVRLLDAAVVARISAVLFEPPPPPLPTPSPAPAPAP